MKPTASPQQRIVLLGASNVARSFARIVCLSQQQWSSPLEILAAFAHGRSLACESSVLGRKISGILSCGLWDDLHGRPALPTAALLTDIGNDILYGRQPDQLLQWVAECLDRLAAAGAQVLVTQLPLASIERLEPTRFLLFRTLLFPSSRLTLEQAKSRAREVNAGLVELASERKNTVISVENHWYAFDPIHIRRRFSTAAWHQILGALGDGERIVAPAQPSLWQMAFLHTLPPLERSVLGFSARRNQPSGVLADGTKISLY